MKIFLSPLFAAIALCGLCAAQDAAPSQGSGGQTQEQTRPAAPAPASPAPGVGNVRIAPGSVIPAQLTKGIDAKKAKTGDAVEAKITQDLKAQNGQVVLAKDTKIVGHITEAQPRTKEQKESQVGIVFDKAVLKNAGDVALPLSIQAIVVPSYAGGNESSAGGENAGPPVPSPSSNGVPSTAGGRPGAASSAPSQTTGTTAGDTSAGHDRGAQPQITGETKGVVGNTNLKLAAATNAAEGSLVSSDKGNVKLDNGTLLLLRVNP